jgi:hypothetical protein
MNMILNEKENFTTEKKDIRSLFITEYRVGGP